MAEISIPKTWSFAGAKKHLVSQLHDGALPIVVYKQWSNLKKVWLYRCEPASVVIYEIELSRRS